MPLRRRDRILLLIATGNHRPSTRAERRAMFGPDVAAAYRIEDHVSESDDLVPCPGPGASGQTIRLNRAYMHARALERVGPGGRLLFVATGLSTEALRDLSVEGAGADPETVQAAIQRRFDDALAQHPGATCALFPEGPCCAPLSAL